MIVPFRVAEEAVMAVAANVTTVGGAGRVVKVKSFPLDVAIALVPFTL